MTLPQALRYFVTEAGLNMKRSWRVSLLAILVTAVSLFLGGCLFLFGSNLERSLHSFESQARVVVYLEPGAPEDAVLAAGEAIGRIPGVAHWELVTPQQAAERLIDRSPGLEDVVSGIEDTPLPASFEIEIERSAANAAVADEWIAGLRDLESVYAIDDDREWMRQVAFAAVLLRTGAAIIGLLLLAGSVFIIASVIRLAALLHREEIRVQRLVGATEFFVRGPFVVQGILQGLLGSVAAVAALSGFYYLLEQRQLPELVRSLLLSSFLGVPELVLVMVVGTGAGLVGGILSVRRTEAGLW